MRNHRSHLGDYLRARRNVVQPEDVGLPRAVGRRVPGLRRDEVARRAAISSEYYLRIEQGRVATPSLPVLESLADALLLDDTARVYLQRLARGGHNAPDPSAASARIAALMDQWAAFPAHLTDPNRDIVASNPLNVLLTGGRHVPGVNMLTEVFNPALGAVFGARWEEIARAAVGAFRFDCDPHEPRVGEIVNGLWSEPVFRDAWQRWDVAVSTGYELRVSPMGYDSFDLRVQHLRVPTLRGYQVTIYTPAPGSAGASILSRMRDDLSARVA